MIIFVYFYSIGFVFCFMSYHFFDMFSNEERGRKEEGRKELQVGSMWTCMFFQLNRCKSETNEVNRWLRCHLNDAKICEGARTACWIWMNLKVLQDAPSAPLWNVVLWKLRDHRLASILESVQILNYFCIHLHTFAYHLFPYFSMRFYMVLQFYMLLGCKSWSKRWSI